MVECRGFAVVVSSGRCQRVDGEWRPDGGAEAWWMVRVVIRVQLLRGSRQG